MVQARCSGFNSPFPSDCRLFTFLYFHLIITKNVLISRLCFSYIELASLLAQASKLASCTIPNDCHTVSE